MHVSKLDGSGYFSLVSGGLWGRSVLYNEAVVQRPAASASPGTVSGDRQLQPHPETYR